MKAFKKYSGFIALVLVVVAIVMLFIAPAVKYTLAGQSVDLKDVSAFQLIFGNKDKNLDFNILGFVAFVLVVAGTVLPFLPLPSNMRGLVAAIALVVGGVLLFVFPSTVKSIIGDFSANTNLIIAGIAAILAGLVNGASAVLK